VGGRAPRHLRLSCALRWALNLAPTVPPAPFEPGSGELRPALPWFWHGSGLALPRSRWCSAPRQASMLAHPVPNPSHKPSSRRPDRHAEDLRRTSLARGTRHLACQRAGCFLRTGARGAALSAVGGGRDPPAPPALAPPSRGQ